MKRIYFWAGAIAVVLSLLTSCQSPLSLETNVSVRNTLQTAADPSAGGTGGAELPIETIFGAPAGTYELTSTIEEGIEFDNYLEGLYDIDLSKKEISFELVADADNDIYKNFYRTLEAGTFDRYYFTFADGHNVSEGNSSNSSVSLQVISEKELVVVIGEGFSFNPGSSFTIELD
ncbi:MAG: hypothetical protein MRZ79_15785 [Bacteroidia bacterium]|nr:hypothetical protein [Bacteroidia bacterium]